MTTTYQTSSNHNVTDNERAFRALSGMGIMIAVVAGIIPTPLTMFTVSMIAVYLVMTAILGVDPVYRLTETLAGRSSRVHRGTTKQAHA